MYFCATITNQTALQHKIIHYTKTRTVFSPTPSQHFKPRSLCLPQSSSFVREIPDSQPHYLSLASSQEEKNKEDNDHRPARPSTPFPKQYQPAAPPSRALQHQSQNSPIYIRDSDDDNDTERCGPDSEQGSVVNDLRSSGPKYPTRRSAITGAEHIANFLRAARDNVRYLISEQEAKRAQVRTPLN